MDAFRAIVEVHQILRNAAPIGRLQGVPKATRSCHPIVHVEQQRIERGAVGRSQLFQSDGNVQEPVVFGGEALEHGVERLDLLSVERACRPGLGELIGLGLVHRAELPVDDIGRVLDDAQASLRGHRDALFSHQRPEAPQSFFPAGILNRILLPLTCGKFLEQS